MNEGKKIEKMVSEAITALLAKTSKTLDNIVFVIEDEPRREKAGEMSIKKVDVAGTI